jgi:hypothetical protein
MTTRFIHTAENVIGKNFGEWTVLSDAEHYSFRGKKLRMVSCHCSCGTVKEVRLSHLKGGRSKSCGCSRGESHGLQKHPIYSVWGAMKQRCANSNNPAYHNYGGRGINVCSRWENSFQNFFDDMGSSWSGGLSLDRVDNDGGYSLKNCRWATPEEQAANKRNTRKHGPGIVPHKNGKFGAIVVLTINLGEFETPEKAAKAIQKSKRKYKELL